MKRSDLQQKIKDRIEMRIREGHYASDTTDYERWAFAHFLADELISLIEEQGMQPPPYLKTILTGPLAKEGKSNLVLLSQVDTYEWEDEE